MRKVEKSGKFTVFRSIIRHFNPPKPPFPTPRPPPPRRGVGKGGLGGLNGKIFECFSRNPCFSRVSASALCVSLIEIHNVYAQSTFPLITLARDVRFQKFQQIWNRDDSGFHPIYNNPEFKSYLKFSFLFRGFSSSSKSVTFEPLSRY